MPCFLISSLVLIAPSSMLCSLKKSNKIAQIRCLSDTVMNRILVLNCPGLSYGYGYIRG